jgi:ABC-type spermidine/putrescine transport system permease subunit I
MDGACLFQAGERDLRTFLPSRLTLEHYRFILQAADQMDRPFMLALGNSILISVTVTLGVLVTSALVGFALSRLQFKGRNMIFNFIIFQMIFPGFMFVVPLYVLIKNLGLIDTRTAVVLPSLVSAWGVFMFTQSFRAVPGEYLEAAKMDGANDLWIIARVLVPLTQFHRLDSGAFHLHRYMGQFYVAVDNSERLLEDAAIGFIGQLQHAVRQLPRASAGRLGPANYADGHYISGIQKILPAGNIYVIEIGSDDCAETRKTPA